MLAAALEASIDAMNAALNDAAFFLPHADNTLTGLIRERKRQDNTEDFVFAEDTGYALAAASTMRAFGCLEQAAWARFETAGLWLCGLCEQLASVPTPWINDEIGLIRSRYTIGLAAWDRIVTFDNAIGLLGLLRLLEARWRWDLHARLFGIASALAQQTRPDGRVPWALSSKAPFSPLDTEEARWSRRSGCFHGKVAEALIEADRILHPGDDHLTAAARRICDATLTDQLRNGRFGTHEERTDLHAAMYAAEGLLHAGEAFNERRYVDAAVRAVAWALSQFNALTPPALIPQIFSDDGTPIFAGQASYRTDAIAQVVRLGSILDQRGLLPTDDRAKLDSLATRLFTLSLRDPKGVVPNGYYVIDGSLVVAQTVAFWPQYFAFTAALEWTAAQASRATAAVILAGGEGTRCWPASTKTQPKPVAVVVGHRTLLQQSYDRIKTVAPPHRTFVTCASLTERLAREQIPELTSANVVVEQQSKGTLKAIDDLGDRLTSDVVVITMADQIFRPLDALRLTLLRAVLACLEGQADVAAIGLQWSAHKRFGAFILGDSADHVLRYSEHVEKPSTPLDDQRVALNVGVYVFRLASLRQSISRGNFDWSTKPGLHAVLNATDETFVALLPDSTRFADLGVPDEWVVRFFEETEFDRGNRVIVIAPHAIEITTQACSDLVVIAAVGGGRPARQLSIVDLHEHVVLFGEDAFAVGVVPFAHTDFFLSMHNATAHIAPEYLHGGFEAPPLPLHEIDIDSPSATIGGTHGAVFVYSLQDVGIHSTDTRVEIWGEKRVELSEIDRQLVRLVRDDHLLVSHILDVRQVGLEFARALHFAAAEEWRDLLKLTLLIHDLGGVLSGLDHDIETRFIGLLRDRSRLGISVDSQIVEAILENLGGVELSPPERIVLSRLNDSVASASLSLQCPKVLAFPLRDELLYIVANQDFGERFSREVIERRLRDTEVDQVRDVWALLATAEQFVGANSVRKPLPPWRTREDLARGVAFLVKLLMTAGIDPEPYVRVFCRYVDTPLARRLRGPDPLFPSDRVLKSFYDGDAQQLLSTLVSQEFAAATNLKVPTFSVYDARMALADLPFIIRFEIRADRLRRGEDDVRKLARVTREVINAANFYPRERVEARLGEACR